MTQRERKNFRSDKKLLTKKQYFLTLSDTTAIRKYYPSKQRSITKGTKRSFTKESKRSITQKIRRYYQRDKEVLPNISSQYPSHLFSCPLIETIVRVPAAADSFIPSNWRPGRKTFRTGLVISVIAEQNRFYFSPFHPPILCPAYWMDSTDA